VDPADAALIALLEETIPELVRRLDQPGLAIAVARRGELIWERGFGYADLASRRPMTPDVHFRSGSMGKTYVATAIMQLVERGAIALDGHVSEYVGFPVVNPLGEREVTVEDLLTHRSGLTTNGASSSFAVPGPVAEHLRADLATSRTDVFRGGLPKWSEPVGSTVQYSNTGIALLGLIVERMNADGLTYGQYLRTHIVEPLSMTSTYTADGDYTDPAQVPPEVQANVGTGYAGWGDLNVPTPRIFFRDYPAGLILTIPRDHIRLLLAYLNGGELGGRRILARESVAALLEPRVAMPGTPDVQLGLVWWRGDLGRETEWFGHGGAHMWGWENDYRAYPKLGLATVVTTNRWGVPTYSAVGYHVASLVEEVAGGFAGRPRAGSRESWTWKRSYAVGLSLVTSSLFYLGIPQPFPVDYAASVEADGLDAGAFRAAVADLAGVEPSVDGLQAFLDSDACRLSRGELNAVWATLGGLGPFPLPAEPAVLAALRAAGS
jgi:CubicO group peptidase (beta-lactamase class C family)